MAIKTGIARAHTYIHTYIYIYIYIYSSAMSITLTTNWSGGNVFVAC
jgi:hypothetical protein